LYRETHPYRPATDRPYAYLWPFEEAAKATLLVYGMPGGAKTYARDVQARLAEREKYWDGRVSPRGYRSYPQSGDRYYDDNAWVGSDLLQHYLLTGDGTALARAKEVLAFGLTGWEGDPTRFQVKPGGEFWVDAGWNRDRGTGPTGGTAKLAAHLYDATGRTTASYRERAEEYNAWVRRWLLGTGGLYWDNILPDAAESVDTDEWIYNQGVMIGANVLLHRITGEGAYRQEAVRLADLALRVYTTDERVGGTDPYYNRGWGAYSGRGMFNAIFFRNLLLLYAVTQTAAYRQAIQDYADRAWADPNVRDPRTGLFRLDGGARYSLLDQAAMVQVYACLAWEPASYGKLT
jgi:hypothetical protein